MHIAIDSLLQILSFEYIFFVWTYLSVCPYPEKRNHPGYVAWGSKAFLPCFGNLKAASHDSQMLVTATDSQQMTEVIASTSSFDQLNWRRHMLHFCRQKPSAQISHDAVS